MYITAFRNHLTMMRRNISGVAALGNGVLANLLDQNNKRGIGLTVYQKWYSFVGNVIGVPERVSADARDRLRLPATFAPARRARSSSTSGSAGPSAPTPAPRTLPIWQIGYDGSDWFTTQEPTSQATTQRDGNYDYFTKQVHWHGIGGTGQGQRPHSACGGHAARLALPPEQAVLLRLEPLAVGGRQQRIEPAPGRAAGADAVRRRSSQSALKSPGSDAQAARDDGAAEQIEAALHGEREQAAGMALQDRSGVAQRIPVRMGWP